MAMRKLSVDLQCLISSSLQINNFRRVIEELVYNSLDAKATSIAVRVDIAENKIQVVDNGCGITESDFDLIGQKYCTSKCVDLNTLKSIPNAYGFRGQFLAKLLNIAQKVKITSRFEKGEDTWVKIFYNGKERDLAKTTTRPSVGTTVEVSGLFYNLHIKSKNLESLNEMTDIKTLLKQLSVVHSSISISLRDDSKNEVIFKAHKNRNIYQTFGLLFNIDEKDIVELKVEKKEYKVTAYFGKKDKDVGEYHWIYLNGTFLDTCKLYKIVNDHLNKSLKFISKRKVKSKVDNEEDLFTKKNIPFYIILLSCPYYDYDISDFSKHTTLEFKNWQDISNLLNKLISFYTGNDTLKNKITKNVIKPKIIEDDTRNQVRKIVEKLLKSNSKKFGVSQMQNGIRGKFTKRNRKKKPTNISISKVIPSKNKIIRQPSKNPPKKVNVNDEILLELNSPTSMVQTVENNSAKQKEKRESQHYKTMPKHNLNKKGKSKYVQKQDKIKKSHKTNILNDSVGSINMHKSTNTKYKDIDSNIIQNNETPANIRNREKENYYNNICNTTNNNKHIALTEKMEKNIIYDYIPHPLNSSQRCDINTSRLKMKQHISSRDLVKTILNTQPNKVLEHERIKLHHEEKSKPESIQMPIKSNIQNAFETSPNVREQIENKNITRESTFHAWNLNIQLDSHFKNKLTDDGMFVSKMTFESHQYNKYIRNDNKINIGRTKNFITKQSRENFISSIEKQKKKNSYRNKFTKHLPKFNIHDVNMSFGIKSFFKNKNLLPDSSYMIDCSDSTGKNNFHKIKSQQCYETIHPKEEIIHHANLNNVLYKSDLDEEFHKEYTVISRFKNTSTIHENPLYTSDNYLKHCQSYEAHRYTEKVLQGTYTIETKNENCHQINNHEQEYYKENENNGDLNVVFISEPQIEIGESSTDKNIEPIDICETILNSKSLTEMEKDLNLPNHDIAEVCLKSSKVSLQEFSHHFNINTNFDPISNITQNFNTETNVQDINVSNINSNNEAITKLNNGNLTFLKNPGDGTNQNNPKGINNFSMKNRPRYMPKGMSQIFEHCNTKGVCDYNLNEEYYKCKIYEEFINEVDINTEIFKPKVQSAAEETSKDIEKVNTRLHKENSSLTFDGQLLKQAQVLGQVDSKFIAAIVKSKSGTTDFLVLLDQHAVHERIRLEKNMSDYFIQQEWKSVKLDVFVLKLTKDEILYLHNYKEKFSQLGLEWDILNNYEVSVFGIPEAILGKNPRQVEKVITAVKNLILEEIDAIKSQRGCISLHPKAIMDLVFSEACRYAIKFGDKLTTNDCRELIQSLSECKTPFQCAHGRPVMAVLMEISSREVYEYKIDKSKIRSFTETK